MQAVCGQVSCTRGAAGQRPEQAGGQREASGRQHASEVTWQLVGPAVAAAANGTGSWGSLNGPILGFQSMYQLMRHTAA